FLSSMSMAFISQSVRAQTCCSAGAPITSAFDIGSSNQRSWAFQLDYEYNSVNLLIENNRKLENDPRRRNGHNVLFKTDFALNKHWAFSAFLPLVIQNRTTLSDRESARGVGDLTLLSQYTHYPWTDTELKFSGGFKLPTGAQFIADDRGINLSPDMQSGSGTVDFIGRIAVVRHHAFIRNLTNQTALSYRYNTTNDNFGDPDGNNGRQFKFGNETQLSSTFAYAFVSKLGFIVPELGIQLRHATPNEEQGGDAPNSGGYWLRMPFGLQVKPTQQFSVRAFGEIPIKQYLEGLQITTDYRLGIQLRYVFTAGKSTESLPGLPSSWPSPTE
ncbi:MAG: hypothetical protein AAGD05_10285, partial [Bacteroidota bacterium]